MEEDDELFEVECFLNTRVKDGKRYYKVRWKGFPPEEDTWEPEENVLECQEVLEAFWRKRRRSANKRQKIRRYRLLSEEEEQDTASTSRENKATELFPDIEPLGLTRQASKELALCLNKTRKKAKRSSESSSQAGSDVTFTENDVLTQSSQSTLLSFQPGSGSAVPYNDAFSQGSDIKSSETGSDVLNLSTESTNESNSTSDVINISSQESLNQSDLDCSPRETFDKDEESNNGKTNKIEIISLLSDSEDNEVNGTGSQPSETQSPHVLRSPLDVSRDSSPVIRRESFITPEKALLKSSPLIETPESEKITSLKQSPVSIIESGEDLSIFETPVRRKNRFELSLKKNRRRRTNSNKNESSSPGSPKTEEKVLNVGEQKRDNCSHENLEKREVKTQLQLLKERMTDVEKRDNCCYENMERPKVKTQLQLLKERMTEVENSEKMLESESKLLGISQPKAKRTLIAEENESMAENAIDDVCPTISQLKGIMHKIARNKYQQDLEANLSGTEMDGIENQRSSVVSALSACDISKAITSETKSSGEDGLVEKTVSAHENEIALEFFNSGVTDQMLVKDKAAFAFGERISSVEDGESSNKADEDVMKSLVETESKDGKLKDVENDQKSGLSGLEKGVDLKRRCNDEEENSNSIGEAISEKDQEKKDVAPSSSKKASVLTSETTSRVLKNLRFLAAKSRESKSIETTMNETIREEKIDDTNSNDVESENNFRNTIPDYGNAKLVLEEELIGIGKNLDENGNTVGEIGLMNENNTPIDDENVETDKDVKSVVEDNFYKCTEIKDSEHQAENMTCVGRLTDEKTKPALPETKQETVPHTPELSKSSCDSLSRKEKNYEPNYKDNMSDDFALVEEDDMMSVDSDISNTTRPNSTPAAQSLGIHEATSTQSFQGDDKIEETSTQNFQKTSALESKPEGKKFQKKIREPKIMSSKSHGKATPGKTVKRKKRLQSDTNNLNSKNLNPNRGVDIETEVSSASTKKISQNSKSKRTKAKKRTKEDEKNSVAKNFNPPLQTTREEQRKMSVILDANFSSNLTSGDLIGAIIDEGDKETTLNVNQKKTSVVGNKNSKDLVTSREEDDTMIEDDDDFDFELEEFPLEKLLQEEDDIDLRYIPSPPVEPMEVPFASVKTAIRDGDEMTVRAALAGGLELDTLDGASGMTLLMLAAASGQDGVVELLLRRKADVNACQKNGMTALMHACEQGYPETAHVLLLGGADINKHQIAGETALMKACKKGHTDVVEVLLRNGADTGIESKSGHTAQQFAMRGFPELSSLIEEHEKRLGRVVEEAILKCLGDTVCLCKPAILSHRCVVPREGQQMTLPFHYSPQRYNKEADVILFCIKAVFDDALSLLFGEDNGVRGVLLNNKSQIPLLHGVRSIFSIDPKSRHNTITLQTHKCNNPASRIILCIYAVQSKS